MEVRVNVLNEMKKLRKNTYADRYAWVDELIQNCQRSKATRIDVTIDYDQITVSDNGIGCDDPHVLFDKSSSGWDEETTTNESPFGEGFFSTMMVANLITVKSVGFMAVFDVEKMFREENTDVIETMPIRKRTGFSVTMTNLVPEYNYYSTVEKFKETAKYIKSPSVYINGEKVKYEGLSPAEDTPYLTKIDNEYFRGWICPHSYNAPRWYYSSGVKCFAFERLVKVSTLFSGVRGIISFKPNAVNLRSPDRKEFIFDEKYDTCVDELRNSIKKMYLKVVREASDEDLKIYEEKIRSYLDINAYKKHIKFKFLNKKNEIEVSANDENNTPDSDFGDDYDSAPISDIDSAAVETYSDFGSISYAITPVENTEPTTKRGRPKVVSAQTGTEIDSSIDYAFYVEGHELDKYAEPISIAQYHNIPVIEIRNSLELSVAKEEDKLVHISEMQDMLKISVEYRNMFPANEQETRALKLLSRMAEALGANSNLFVIADTTFRKILTVNGNDFTIEELDTFAAAYSNQIFINRKHMAAYDKLTDDSPDLTDEDRKFILLNLKLLAHELSHIMFGTVDQTMEHESCTNNLMQKIIDLIYGKNRLRLCA